MIIAFYNLVSSVKQTDRLVAVFRSPDIINRGGKFVLTIRNAVMKNMLGLTPVIVPVCAHAEIYTVHAEI